MYDLLIKDTYILHNSAIPITYIIIDMIRKDYCIFKIPYRHSVTIYRLFQRHRYA